MADRPASVVVVGAGGHARVLVEALADRAIAGHLAPAGSSAARVLGPHLGGDEMIAALARSGHEFIVGMGFVDHAGAQRRAALLRALSGASLVTVVHPHAFVSLSATLDEGAFVAVGAIVGAGARLGGAAIVNSGAVVDHDCRLGANVHVASGAVLAGNVRVDDDTLVGAGAVVRQGVTVGHGVVIGAGAVVIADLPDGTTAVGVPARPRS